ncbi:hypothetical protein C8J56DRAFT_936067 [Mycena floridula]|nr:hypothetical protein C8J56DRAFT_936067 [Mycena floridula]
MPTLSRIFVSALSFLLLCPFALSKNVTIDDTVGNLITYFPTGAWSEGAKCTDCTSKLDPSLTYMRTWRDTSQFGNTPNITATVTFAGTAVKVIGILDHHSTTPTDLTFYLDGVSTTPFFDANANADANPRYTYNVTYFSAASLASTSHTLVIQVGNGDPAAEKNSNILLDSIVYTALEGSASLSLNPSGTKTGSTAKPSTTSSFSSSSVPEPSSTTSMAISLSPNSGAAMIITALAFIALAL